MASETPMDVDIAESLVSRRPKRSTAGNRMEAALAELGLEDLNKEAEDDNEFFVVKDEEDIFGSDFESTDEETGQIDEQAGEKAVDEEEKRNRKAKRTQLERTTAAAHARNKFTFNPQSANAEASSSKLQSPSISKLRKSARRVSFVDGNGEEVSAVLNTPTKGKTKAKRKSRRSHTVLNTSATVSRLKTAEERRATIPKKAPVIQKSYTQAELLARALDTEEGNITEHRDYLRLEEEKRKRARVVRTHIVGPLVRWVSRGEDVKVQVPVARPAERSQVVVEQIQLVPRGVMQGGGQQQGYYSFASGQNSMASPTPYQYPPQYPIQSTSSTSQLPNLPQPQLQTSYYYNPTPGPPPPPPEPITRIEKQGKNYVIHELSQSASAAKPAWYQTMAALFDEEQDEKKWEDMKIYAGKNRPLSRPKQSCPLTGLHAKYLDPRTNVPYANVRAYKTLTKVLDHGYVWSESLGRYMGEEGERRALGLEGKERKGKEKEKGKMRSREVNAMDLS